MRRAAGRPPAAVRAVLALSALAGLLYLSGWLKPLEWRAYDLRLGLVADDAPDRHLALVAIDDKSLAALGRWPWPRETHARLVAALRAAGARVVAFDIEFPEPSPDPRSDERLARAARAAGNVVVAAAAPLEPIREPGPVRTAGRLPPPVAPISSAVGVGHIDLQPDPDGVMRRYLAAVASPDGLVPALGLVAAARYLGVPVPEWDGRSPAIRLGGRPIPVDRWGRFLIAFATPGVFPVVSYVDVLDGAADPSVFRDRLVLVGSFAPTLGDLRTFPVLPPLSPGVLAHANAIKTVLDGTFVTPVPRSVNLLAVLLLTFLPGLLYARLSPLLGAVVLVALLTAYAAANTALLAAKGLLVDLTHPALGLGLSYLGALGVRIVSEQRERLRVTAMFQRYVGPEVVKEILAAGEDALRLGGVRRPLTVLFLDVRNFTPLSERLQPEEVVRILNRSFEMITQVIFKHGGTLDKFIGDAVMVLFNAPLDLPDHPLRAVLAAREIQERARAIQAELEARYGCSVRFGIGINTGEAVVGNIGSSTRMEYTAIGDAVNLAARLESVAGPGQILISESTWQAVAGRVEAEPLGPIPVKGKSRPVNVYAVKVPAGGTPGDAPTATAGQA